MNRRRDGVYHGRVHGVDINGVEIQASSLCQLRRIFESVVDEFLRTALPQRSLGAAIGDLESETINFSLSVETRENNRQYFVGPDIDPGQHLQIVP